MAPGAKPRKAEIWFAASREAESGTCTPLAPRLPRRPWSAAYGLGPSVFTIRARKSGTARGKASASLAKQLERVARSGLSHIAMDAQNVIGRWCGARYGSGLADASRGRPLFDGGAGFAGLRGRPSPSPAGRSGPSPAEGPRRSRQCPSGPAGAAYKSKIRGQRWVTSEGRGEMGLDPAEPGLRAAGVPWIGQRVAEAGRPSARRRISPPLFIS